MPARTLCFEWAQGEIAGSRSAIPSRVDKSRPSSQPFICVEGLLFSLNADVDSAVTQRGLATAFFPVSILLSDSILSDGRAIE